jgi:hypothetical protein
VELTQDQIEQQGRCQSIDCECKEIQTQEEWSKEMRLQGWMDFGIDFQKLNPAHGDDPDYDRGVEQAYQNR